MPAWAHRGIGGAGAGAGHWTDDADVAGDGDGDYLVASPCLVGGWKRSCGVELVTESWSSTGAASWRRCVDHGHDGDGAAMWEREATGVDGDAVVDVVDGGGVC